MDGRVDGGVLLEDHRAGAAVCEEGSEVALRRRDAVSGGELPGPGGRVPSDLVDFEADADGTGSVGAEARELDRHWGRVEGSPVARVVVGEGPGQGLDEVCVVRGDAAFDQAARNGKHTVETPFDVVFAEVGAEINGVPGELSN